MSDIDHADAEALLRSVLRDDAARLEVEGDGSTQISAARRRYVRRGHVRTGGVAAVAVASMAVVLALIASPSQQGRRTGTSRPLVTLHTRAAGPPEVLLRTAGSMSLELVSPRTGHVIRRLALHLPPQLSRPGISAGLEGQLAAVAGDGTAFAGEFVDRTGQHGGTSTFDLVAISLRTGQEQIIAKGGNPAISPSGQWLAWQQAWQGDLARLTGTIVVENLQTSHRLTFALIPDTEANFGAAASVRMAWSSNSSVLAFSYQTASNEERLGTFTHRHPVGSNNPTEIWLKRAPVGSRIEAITWTGTHELLLGGDNACASRAHLCPPHTDGVISGPALAHVDLKTGVSQQMASPLFDVPLISTDSRSRQTVIAGARVNGDPDNDVVQLLRGKQIALTAGVLQLAWVSRGAVGQ